MAELRNSCLSSSIAVRSYLRLMNCPPSQYGLNCNLSHARIGHRGLAHVCLQVVLLEIERGFTHFIHRFEILPSLAAAGRIESQSWWKKAIPHLQNQRGSSDSSGYPLICSLAHSSARYISQGHTQIIVQAIGSNAEVTWFDLYGSLIRPESWSFSISDWIHQLAQVLIWLQNLDVIAKLSFCIIHMPMCNFWHSSDLCAQKDFESVAERSCFDFTQMSDVFSAIQSCEAVDLEPRPKSSYSIEAQYSFRLDYQEYSACFHHQLMCCQFLARIFSF